MSENKIKNNQDALDAIKTGVNILADTVGKTLGPKGRTVIIRKKHFNTNTKDGVTVARQVFLDDPYENAGAQIVKEAAEQTNKIAGDGTTTATILAQAIVNAGLKNIAAGANPMDLKRGIELAVKKVVIHLKEKSQVVGEDYEKIKQVGTISANNDAEIGELIAGAMEQIGKDGVIYIEESRLPQNKVEIIQGIQIEQGYHSPYFITDTSRNQCVLEGDSKNPVRILLYDGKLTTVEPLLGLLDALAGKQKRDGVKIPFLIIAEEVSGETLSVLIANKANGVFNCCAIRSPFGDDSKEVMKDIAKATGATYITEDDNLRLQDAYFEQLGACEKVIIGELITTIVNGGGEKEVIEDHISDLKSLQQDAPSQYRINQIKDRIAKLSMGVAVIYVGGYTEAEVKEKKDRIEDAVNATRAAVEEGISPGGGVAFIRSIVSLSNVKGDNEDQNTGIDIIRKALERPLWLICDNGAIKGDVVVSDVAAGGENHGYNALTEKYGNMIEMGIIDPTKVVRVALENAASVACLILTTSAIITD